MRVCCLLGYANGALSSSRSSDVISEIERDCSEEPVKVLEGVIDDELLAIIARGNQSRALNYVLRRFWTQPVSCRKLTLAMQKLTSHSR